LDRAQGSVGGGIFTARQQVGLSMSLLQLFSEVISEKYVTGFATISNEVNGSVFILGSLTSKSKVN
jgi:hypothetical protein